MPSHHFHHHHALVRVRGGFQTVQRLGNNGNGAVEAKSDIGRAQVIINGFGTPTTGSPISESKRAVDWEPSPPTTIRASSPSRRTVAFVFPAPRVQSPLLVHAYFDGEVAFVHGSQNGAPWLAIRGRRQGSAIQTVRPLPRTKALQNRRKTHNVPAATGSRAHNTFNNCIQPGSHPRYSKHRCSYSAFLIAEKSFPVYFLSPLWSRFHRKLDKFLGILHIHAGSLPVFPNAPAGVHHLLARE